jgi:hypothetical protein
MPIRSLLGAAQADWTGFCGRNRSFRWLERETARDEIISGYENAPEVLSFHYVAYLKARRTDQDDP